MSLLVSVYIRSEDGRMTIMEPDHSWEELAGFESYRQQLYGSRAARALGLQLLPLLDTSDLYAEGPDLTRLRIEAELALANVAQFEEETGASSEHLRPRFENIIAAANRAMNMGGGVVIW